MKIIATQIVSSHLPNERIIDFALRSFECLPTKNSVKKALKRNEILIDGEVAQSGRFVAAGHKIDILENNLKIKKVFELKLDILYEDEHLAVIYKPAGVGTSGNYFKTIQNAIPFNISTSNLNDALSIAKPVHRLDNPTSGLLLIAKTRNALTNLNKQFENKTISKQYHAIVIGIPTHEATISEPIEEKEAITQYEVIQTIESKKYGTLSLIKLSPITGRTHQLRIHTAHIGCPILGDKEYGGENKNPGKGLFLSATNLSFIHPITGETITISTPIPYKFEKILSKENSSNTAI